MKVKFYTELSRVRWDYNLDCLQGRENMSILASTKPSPYRSDDMDLIEFEVDIPDWYFEPRKADVVLREKIKASKIKE